MLKRPDVRCIPVFVALFRTNGTVYSQEVIFWFLINLAPHLVTATQELLENYDWEIFEHPLYSLE